MRATDATRSFLQSQRLGARPYSVSALQNYAYCPYRFLLSAIYRIEPLEEPQPLQRLDPLTKGSLFHEVQAEFFRALEKMTMDPPSRSRASARQADRLTIDDGRSPIADRRSVEALDATLDRIASKYAEELAPAVDRVWRDEIASIRTDLHVWARNLAEEKEWEPYRFEFAFGRVPGVRDSTSITHDVVLEGGFKLRGAIDLIETHRQTKVLRVTDHKTGRKPDRIEGSPTMGEVSDRGIRAGIVAVHPILGRDLRDHVVGVLPQ